MIKTLYYFAAICIFSLSLLSQGYKNYFNYVDPLPESEMINPQTGIIVKPGPMLDKTTLLRNNTITIKGTLSGDCSYEVIKCSDGLTFILKPVKPFLPGETVNISYSSNIKKLNGAGITPFAYTFKIKSSEVKVNKQYNLLSELNGSEYAGIPGIFDPKLIYTELPTINVTYQDNPSPGRIFISNFTAFPNIHSIPHLLILNNDGTIFYSEQLSLPGMDFRMQPNGNLTYFNFNQGRFYELDQYFSVVDSFYCGNGYGTDLHELRLMENRHAWMMSYDSQYVDMSQIVPGGNPNAIVSGLIIQEIDEYKNVVFQWRSWDHFQITDATHLNMTAPSIDYVHGNAIEIEKDGNILISSRHMDEITKINTTTGNIIWRFGGKNNQFTFVNDSDKFSYQHSILRVPNGNVTLFDNGNFHTPPYSRAIEYNLDEVNKIATLVWQYRNSPDIFGFAMGNALRLNNGNTLIGWGFANPNVTEVRPDGTKALEIRLPPGVASYRAFKHEYKMDELVPVTPPESIFLGQNYPNPFNPKTTIKFGLPKLNGTKDAVDVKLVVYDVLGREIAVLLDKQLKPYTYQVPFDGTNLTSGIYFYTLTVTGGNARYYESKKMILIK